MTGIFHVNVKDYDGRDDQVSCSKNIQGETNSHKHGYQVQGHLIIVHCQHLWFSGKERIIIKC